MKNQLEYLIKEALKNLGIEAGNIVLEHPADLKNGDYSTNVALVYAKQKGVNPREFAENIKTEIEKDLPKEISKIEVAGAGFINFYLSRDFFTDATKEILKQKDNWGKNKILSGKKVMVEYTQPNPFKPFHIGHLMSNSIGESISRVVEFSGADTICANYQGDVGPHVAKAIYGIMNDPHRLQHLPLGKGEEGGGLSAQARYIGECYAKGSDAYDNDDNAKKEIEEINKKVYDKSDAEVNMVYDWGRKATLEAFEEIYKLLGTKFDYYFFESEMAPKGQKIVRENIGKVFTESDPTPEQARDGQSGAIVFHGEEHDPKLHTRVFINSKGLPTYETKEVGLTMTKFEKENPDISIVTTAVEQAEYMRVVEKAISIINPEYAERMKHVTHGMMRLATGKMSSRKGNVITGESLIQDSMDVVREKVAERELSDEEKEEIAKVVGVSALKYSILRSSLGSDIVYDFEKSISFDGDSGPYLQYTAVRAKSIMKKAEGAGIKASFENVPTEVTELEHLLYQFPEVITRSYEQLEPHHIATYLTHLASSFNSFYGNTIIVNTSDSFAPYNLALVESFYQTMTNGLWLLGIKTPEKM